MTTTRRVPNYLSQKMQPQWVEEGRNRIMSLTSGNWRGPILDRMSHRDHRLWMEIFIMIGWDNLKESLMRSRVSNFLSVFCDFVFISRNGNGDTFSCRWLMCWCALWYNHFRIQNWPIIFNSARRNSQWRWIRWSMRRDWLEKWKDWMMMIGEKEERFATRFYVID